MAENGRNRGHVSHYPGKGSWDRNYEGKRRAIMPARFARCRTVSSDVRHGILRCYQLTSTLIRILRVSGVRCESRTRTWTRLFQTRSFRRHDSGDRSNESRNEYARAREMYNQHVDQRYSIHEECKSMNGPISISTYGGIKIFTSSYV